MWKHFQNLIWYKGYIQLYMNLLYVSKEIPREIYVLFLLNLDKAYLPGTEVNHDHEGGSSRVRLFHCTLVWLTPTITPNVGNLSAQFLLVGDCACALPQFYPWNYKKVFVELTSLSKLLLFQGTSIRYCWNCILCGNNLPYLN